MSGEKRLLRKKQRKSNPKKFASSSGYSYSQVDQDKPQECAICLETVTIRGALSICEHWFCFACIYEWSKMTNTCPLCKGRFRCITKFGLSSTASPEKQFRIKDREQQIEQTDEDMELAIELANADDGDDDYGDEMNESNATQSSSDNYFEDNVSYDDSFIDDTDLTENEAEFSLYSHMQRAEQSRRYELRRTTLDSQSSDRVPRSANRMMVKSQGANGSESDNRSETQFISNQGEPNLFDSPQKDANDDNEDYEIENCDHDDHDDDEDDGFLNNVYHGKNNDSDYDDEDSLNDDDFDHYGDDNDDHDDDDDADDFIVDDHEVLEEDSEFAQDGDNDAGGADDDSDGNDFDERCDDDDRDCLHDPFQSTCVVGRHILSISPCAVSLNRLEKSSNQSNPAYQNDMVSTSERNLHAELDSLEGGSSNFTKKSSRFKLSHKIRGAGKRPGPLLDVHNIDADIRSCIREKRMLRRKALLGTFDGEENERRFNTRSSPFLNNSQGCRNNKRSSSYDDGGSCCRSQDIERMDNDCRIEKLCSDGGIFETQSKQNLFPTIKHQKTKNRKPRYDF